MLNTETQGGLATLYIPCSLAMALFLLLAMQQVGQIKGDLTKSECVGRRGNICHSGYRGRTIGWILDVKM